jgi:hypothetical protein
MTIEERVLRNVMEDMEKEVEVFEKIYERDEEFNEEFTNISYTMYINSIARIKEVLFRMSINNKES